MKVIAFLAPKNLRALARFYLGDLVSGHLWRWMWQACSFSTLVLGRRACWLWSSQPEPAVGVICHTVWCFTPGRSSHPCSEDSDKWLGKPPWEAHPERDVTSVSISLLQSIASFAFLWDTQLSQWPRHSFNATTITVTITGLSGGGVLLPNLALSYRLVWFSWLSFLSRWVLKYVPLIVQNVIVIVIIIIIIVVIINF